MDDETESPVKLKLKRTRKSKREKQTKSGRLEYQKRYRQENAIKLRDRRRLDVQKETFDQWGSLREALSLTTNDEVAVLLLTTYEHHKECSLKIQQIGVGLAGSERSYRKKQKLVTPEYAKDEDYAEDMKEETSFEEFSIPPLFPSRLPLNDEEEEDEDEPNPDLELKSDEDSLTRPTGVSLLTDITSQCRRLQEMDYEIGPYCREAGISEADIMSNLQNVSSLPTVKNGLVLEIYDYFNTMQMCNPKRLVETLKRLADCPQASDWSIGAFIERLVERRDNMQPRNKEEEKDLRFLQEEKFQLTRKRTYVKQHETRRDSRERGVDRSLRLLRKDMALAKKQRAKSWKYLDRLEIHMQHSRQENAALSEKVKELITENRHLRAMVSHLEEQCQPLEKTQNMERKT
ncbi:uncharacterized protein LOC763306 isoform X1 [Strongylocentrotus purpuratus]|uniref:Uncharacterized protein n=1 Tax=Strongylocentrotus purpuratus TaxID=7668 RepID=A0A7M7HK37_STRPU|nr:uncharacterized protein LOC763306 isoform X1 [Strongylocentrotus purpuratus]